MTGTGTVVDPYVILTPADLDAVRNDLGESVYYELGADIDLSSFPSWIPIATMSNGSGFMGHFDDKGFTISNMTITSAFHDPTFGAAVGLFGDTTISSLTTFTSSYTIQNLILNSCSINLDNYSIDPGSWNQNGGKLFVGLLAGRWYDYTFPATSSLWNAIRNIQIKNSSINIVKTNVTSIYTESLSTINLGGLLGYVAYGLVTSCSVDNIRISGNVSSSYITPVVYVGGLATNYVQLTYCAVRNSYVQFQHKSNNTDNPNLFIAGMGDSQLEVECHDNYVYNTVVSGALKVSGFVDSIAVGETQLGDAGHYFPSGKAYTNATFGNTPTSSVYVFARQYTEFDSSSSLYNYVATSSGITSNDPTPSGMPAIGVLSVSQMQDSASYVGFDFTSVWTIDPTKQGGLPYFGWQSIAPDPVVSLTLLSPLGGETYNANLGDIIPVSWSYT